MPPICCLQDLLLTCSKMLDIFEHIIADSPQVNELHEVPISRLPPEILEDVFALCVLWFYSFQKPENCFAWIQVCKAWRNIGLNSGRLWQRIDLNAFTCATEFLLRSRQAPLHVMATSPLKDIPSNLVLHANRLHSIEICLFQMEMARLFINIGQDLPTLVNLSLKVVPITSSIFLDLSLPSLRRLSLEGVSIRWEECRNLTYFSLCGPGYQQAFSPSLSKLFAIFYSSPDLEYVRLGGFSPSSRHPDTVELPFISLCHLKDFIISSCPSVIQSILSTVTLGRQTRLQLYVSLFEGLHSVFPSSPLLQVAATCAEYERSPSRPQDVNNVRISRHGVCFIQNNSPTWCDDPAMFRISLSSAELTSIHVCRSLNYVVDLKSITRLELNGGVLLDIPPQALKSLFRDLRQLQSLCTAFNEMVDLFHTLGSVDETTRLVYLPQLVRLSFGKPTDTWWRFGEKWTGLIFDILRTRQAHSCSLQILELCNCYGLTPAMIEAFERLADEVVVIDVEQTFF